MQTIQPVQTITPVEAATDEAPARDEHRPEGRMWIAAVLAASATALWWCWATASGAVPLDVAGDESARMLESLAAASPGRLVDLLTDSSSWTQIHPPGDVAFKAIVNTIAGVVVDDPATLVHFNQYLGTCLVVAGMAAMAYGLRTLSGAAVAVFLGMAVPGAGFVYVAHHALGENLALALVGAGAAHLLRGRPVAGGVLVGLSGLVRPEAALVFATLAAVPLATRRQRAAVTFAALAAAPAVVHTMATELAGTSYASVDLFRNRSLFSVAFTGDGPTAYWGLGIWPWLGCLVAAVILVAGVVARVPMFSAGRLLLAGWAVWCLIYAALAARGAIPTQVRTYVFPQILGALAIAVATHEVLAVLKPPVGRVVSIVAAAAVVVAAVAATTTRREWRDAYPPDVVAVNEFLAASRNTDGILTDWMWWREWTAGVYATPPAGDVCNYKLCTVGTDSTPPPSLTGGLTEIEVRRLTQAWRFVDSSPPRFIAMFNDAAYAEWRQWEQRAHPETLSSFVRPLLVPAGTCFVTASGLPPTRYCPVYASGRYVVLEAG